MTVTFAVVCTHLVANLCINPLWGVVAFAHTSMVWFSGVVCMFLLIFSQTLETGFLTLRGCVLPAQLDVCRHELSEEELASMEEAMENIVPFLEYKASQ